MHRSPPLPPRLRTSRNQACIRGVGGRGEIELTDLDTVVSKPETGEDHLTKTKHGSEGGEEAHG